jgi:hypothetical protein
MNVPKTIGKLWWRKKKAGWMLRTAQFLGRSRNLAFFAGAVALFGGAREAQKRLSHG